jgi:hypothetical protein
LYISVVVLMKKLLVVISAVMLLLPLMACAGNEIAATTEAPPFPLERPDLVVPDKFELTGPLTVVQGQKVEIDSSIANHSFQNCEVWVVDDNLEIVDSEFVNSPVNVAQRSSIVLNGVIFEELNQYEKAALNVYECGDVVIRNCQFVNNYIGLGVHSSTAVIEANRFEGNNGHNALLIGEGSVAEVVGNYFYGSFPHAMLVLNREGSTDARVDIIRNFIDQTGEDAIDFEDYRNAASSQVFDNVITNTGWSALVVEYNSWGANITLEHNWIEGTGIDWQLPTHPLQADRFQPGWAHGILIEDSSAVQVINNRILLVAENGIEVINSRGVTVAGNGISCSHFGIGVHRYQESSLYRGFSPLAQEDADGSRVTAGGNIIYEALKDFDVDEQSQMTAQ